MSGWISALWPQAINFLLMTMVMGISGSSGVQTTFCWTQFPRVPASERIAVRESTGSVPHGREGRRGFTQCSAVGETDACPFCSWSMGAERSKQWPTVCGGDLPPSITLPFIWLSGSFAFWHPCLPSFYYFISTLVSTLLSFLSKPFFLLFFPSALFLPSIFPLIIFSLFDFLIPFPPSSVTLPLWSLWFNTSSSSSFLISVPPYKPLLHYILVPPKVPLGSFKYYFIIPP